MVPLAAAGGPALTAGGRCAIHQKFRRAAICAGVLPLDGNLRRTSATRPQSAPAPCHSTAICAGGPTFGVHSTAICAGSRPDGNIRRGLARDRHPPKASKSRILRRRRAGRNPHDRVLRRRAPSEGRSAKSFEGPVSFGGASCLATRPTWPGAACSRRDARRSGSSCQGSRRVCAGRLLPFPA